MFSFNPLHLQIFFLTLGCSLSLFSLLNPTLTFVTLNNSNSPFKSLSGKFLLHSYPPNSKSSWVVFDVFLRHSLYSYHPQQDAKGLECSWRNNFCLYHCWLSRASHGTGTLNILNPRLSLGIGLFSAPSHTNLVSCLTNRSTLQGKISSCSFCSNLSSFHVKIILLWTRGSEPIQGHLLTPGDIWLAQLGTAGI